MLLENAQNANTKRRRRRPDGRHDVGTTTTWTHGREDWHCDGDAIAGLEWAGGVRLARFFDDRSVFGQDYWQDKVALDSGGQGLRELCSDAGV